MSSISCIIIDDEELARKLLKSYVDQLDFVHSKGEFENPMEALEVLKSEKIDVVFLDIQMPQLKGTDFAKLIPLETKIIFTTAYSEYALEGFELNASDYLLKPITFKRFLTSVTKIESNSNYKTNYGIDTITIKSGYDLFKVKLNDINYIKSDSEYVIFYTTTGKIMAYQSLKSLLEDLPSSQFMRVHRSYIINKFKVTGLKSRNLYLSKIEIPVSDTYYEDLKKALF
jgi:DNA-binding LytR/AlgR family response regulator